jgi:hypothetical protein
MSRNRGIHQERGSGSQNHIDEKRQHRQLKFPAFNALGINLIKNTHSRSLVEVTAGMIPCYRMKRDARLRDSAELFNA